MKSYLITGGAGFIGSHFVEQAVTAGHRVVVLDSLTYAANLSNLDRVYPHIIFIEGDICDEKLVAQILADRRIECLVNFAAESHVDNSIENSEPFLRTNILGVHVLLGQCVRYLRANSSVRSKFRFLQISTDEVFGPQDDSQRANEDSPYYPSSPYAASKASADHLVRSWHRTYGLPALIVHGSNNFGPRQFPEKLIPKIVQQALNWKALTVYGNGSNVRDWIYVSDFCDSLNAALLHGKDGESYCVAGGNQVSNLSLVLEICNILNVHVPSHKGRYESLIQFVADRPGHDARYAMDTTKARTELRFQPYRPNQFREFLRKTVLSYIT